MIETTKNKHEYHPKESKHIVKYIGSAKCQQKHTNICSQ